MQQQLFDCSLLNIAYHLEHNDCLMLEICCKSFREILFKSPFHDWCIVRKNTSNGYILEAPNGKIEHELQIMIGSEWFLEYPSGIELAIVTQWYDNQKLNIFYNLEDNMAHITAFFWHNQLWMIVTYGVPATYWWRADPCRIGLCTGDLNNKPISRNNLVFEPSVYLDTLGTDFAKYISSHFHIPRNEL